MNKKIVKLIIGIVILALVIGGVVLWWNHSHKRSNLMVNEVYSIIETNADLTENYSSYDEVFAASESIVIGTVENTKSYMEDTRISTLVTFKIDTVLKGSLRESSTISVWTSGGMVKFSEYAAPQIQYLQAKMSSEELEKEVKEHGDEYVESIFENTKNVQEGERLGLCLKKSEEGNYYVITGSIAQGLFRYDEDTETIYREKQELNQGKKGKIVKEKKISSKEFIKKGKESKTIQTKPKEDTQEQEGPIDVEIDHSYDKYK